jgi:integrase
MVDIAAKTLKLERDKASLDGRTVMLSDTAVAILESLPRLARCPWVFPGRRRDGHLIDLEFHWRQALERAGLRHIRLHDLRHSYAAASVSSGISLYTTGKLLGHRSSRTAERYSHLSPQAQREAADRVHGLLS